MKTLCATAAFLAWTLSAGGQADPAKAKACDVAKVQGRDYCYGCKMFVAKDAILKTGICAKCRTMKIQVVNTCVKTAFACWKHGGKLHSKDCQDSPRCCTATEVLALALFRCDKCGESSVDEKEIKHQPAGCGGKAFHTCADSGTFPHGGEEAP